MLTTERVAVLTRSSPGLEKTARQLVNYGIHSILLPLTQTVSVDDESQNSWIRNESEIQGVCLTSVTAARLFKAWLHKHSALFPSLPACYCIGQTTWKTALDCGLVAYWRENIHTGYQLAEWLDKLTSPSKGIWLYPCARQTAGTLERECERRGIRLAKLVLYETVPRIPNKAELQEIARFHRPVWVFHSPSAVKVYINHVQPLLKQWQMGEIQAVAIGTTTADAIRKTGIQLAAIASEPNDESLVSAIGSVQDLNSS